MTLVHFTSEVSMSNNFSDGILPVDLGWVVCPISCHHVDGVFLELNREAVSVNNVPVQDIKLWGDGIRG